jgi:hypothetical protein
MGLYADKEEIGKKGCEETLQQFKIGRTKTHNNQLKSNIDTD